MITIINERNGYKTRFKNYQKLYTYINHRQRVKRYNRPNWLIDDWFFACHSHNRVMALNKLISVVSKQQKFDVLEISYDKSEKPVIVSITPNLNIESFLEDWCRRWCVSHGYDLVEIQDDDGILHVKKSQYHSPNGNQDLLAIG